MKEVWGDSILAERRELDRNMVQKRARGVTFMGSTDVGKWAV